ncbi:MAG TPA: alpha/beta hydrolase, partial [Acidimicrobiales bacterium]|nr:alpha/beta hydrolase [Acidimicrobiales bacterium]
MDGRADLDPEVAEAFELAPIASIDFGTYTFADLPGVRDAMANMPRPELPPTRTVSEERMADGVPVRVYRPSDGPSPAPMVLWVHGGGFIFGSGLTEDARCNGWADAFGCVIVSVEYRLAPEHPYPAPLEDCYTALTWAASHAEELGINPGHIVVVGQSAGGGLAAGLALLVRDRGEVQLAYQLLIYPMIDDRNSTTSSRLNAVVWSPGANLLGWRAYLGDLYGTDRVPVYAAPGRATELAGLPPTFIGVGTLDVFRDEDITYALDLLAAGVETELHVYPGAPHGFEMITPDATVA